MNYDTLVLSGGGIKGFSLLGSVQCLIDLGEGKEINTYIGTSAGAMLCYLLAIGYTPIEIIVALYTHKWLEKIQHVSIVDMINGCGATSFTSLNEALEKLTLNKIGRLLTLGKLKEIYNKNLICCTYNITTCKAEYLGPENYPDLPCLIALRMSSNIPLIFERFKYMDNYYIDGGIVDNFPIVKGIEVGKKVLGIHLNIEDNKLKDEPEEGIISYFLKLLYIPMIQLSKNNIEKAKDKATIISINGKMRNIIEFNIHSKIRLEMFSEGYETVKKYMQEKTKNE